MKPKGHCMFCDCLTEHGIGSKAICEDCLDELYHSIFHAHKHLETHYLSYCSNSEVEAKFK